MQSLPAGAVEAGGPPAALACGDLIDRVPAENWWPRGNLREAGTAIELRRSSDVLRRAAFAYRASGNRIGEAQIGAGDPQVGTRQKRALHREEQVGAQLEVGIHLHCDVPRVLDLGERALERAQLASVRQPVTRSWSRGPSTHAHVRPRARPLARNRQG